MTSNLNELKVEAVKAAIHIRKSLGYAPDETFCIFDAAPKLGIDVRFLDLDSVDGLACRSDPPTIILTSLRPELRRRFTCAHEIGHLVLNHEAEADIATASLSSNKRPDIELLADLFAGQLLMPKLLLASGLPNLHDPLSPLRFFEFACSIGVGLNTLLTHAHRTARVIKSEQANFSGLSKVRNILNLDKSFSPLLAVGENWSKRPIDVDLGTYIHFTNTLHRQSDPPPLCEYIQETPHGTVFRANKIGSHKSSQQTIRVMPPGYYGRAVFRHMEQYD